MKDLFLEPASAEDARKYMELREKFRERGDWFVYYPLGELPECYHDVPVCAYGYLIGPTRVADWEFAMVDREVVNLCPSWPGLPTP